MHIINETLSFGTVVTYRFRKDFFRKLGNNPIKMSTESTKVNECTQEMYFCTVRMILINNALYDWTLMLFDFGWVPVPLT